MKKNREIKSSKTQKGTEFEPKRNGNSVSEKSYVWPEENEEQRTMDIRVKEQPFQSSSKPEKKKNQKVERFKNRKNERQMITAVFFDIGGVLLSNGWGHLSTERAAKKISLNYQEMDVLHNFIFNVFEIGSIALNDYLDTVVFNHPRDFSKEEFKNFMFTQSVELPDMLPWLKEWKKNCGFHVFSINNESRELNDYLIKKFSLHQLCDGFVSSCHVGMRKPDLGILHLAMGIAQVRPEECAYFDDRLMLAASARNLGINSFYHQDFETTRKNLKKAKD